MSPDRRSPDNNDSLIEPTNDLLTVEPLIFSFNFRIYTIKKTTTQARYIKSWQKKHYFDSLRPLTSIDLLKCNRFISVLRWQF